MVWYYRSGDANGLTTEHTDRYLAQLFVYEVDKVAFFVPLHCIDLSSLISIFLII
jgi:hypothetical protein